MTRRERRALPLLCAVTTLLIAHAATAQELEQLTWFSEGDTTTLSCEPLDSCGPGTVCELGKLCREVGDNAAACLSPVDAVFPQVVPLCCNSDVDIANPCPVRNGEAGVCRSLLGDISVCVWPNQGRTAINFCASFSVGGGIDLENVRACFAPANADGGLRALVNGDCDRDGTLNRDEESAEAVCDPDDPVERDQGVGEPEDMGTVIVPPFDSSFPEPDLHLGLDLGAPHADAGGITAGPRVGFNGGGGCDAGGAAWQPHGGGPLLAGLVLLAAGVRRRERLSR